MGCLPYAKNDGHPSCDRPPPPSLGTTGLRIAPTHPIDSSPDCGDESRHPIVSVFTRPVWPCRRNRYRHHEPPARATRQHAARCKRHAKAARQVARRRTAGRAAQARPRRCAPGARHSPAGHGRPGCRRPPPAPHPPGIGRRRQAGAADRVLGEPRCTGGLCRAAAPEPVEVAQARGTDAVHPVHGPQQGPGRCRGLHARQAAAGVPPGEDGPCGGDAGRARRAGPARRCGQGRVRPARSAGGAGHRRPRLRHQAGAREGPRQVPRPGRGTARQAQAGSRKPPAKTASPRCGRASRRRRHRSRWL